MSRKRWMDSAVVDGGRAADEIATASFGVDRPVVKAAALAILRKHRDGKA